MKIVIAPDSYKESLSASEVAQAIEKGFREIFPDAQYVSVPVADGGEGTVEAMIAATQGAERHAWVTGPLGEKVNASWGISGDGKTHASRARLSKWRRPVGWNWYLRKNAIHS
ncbi:hypothetical protein EIMP300_20760 [Escherichia coli]|uniref:Glycerate 3-kinase n=1 Tax=Escherichia coli TaxID=562 RepID=A0A8S0FL39_ECOLX|nr:hypothetical protein EIMP300_20760 [Escherichia coli]